MQKIDQATNPKEIDGVLLPTGTSPAIAAVNRLIQPGRAVRFHRAHPRGIRYRQRDRRARHPRREPAPPAPVRRRQLRRHSRRAARERAVRSREGLVHRRHHHPQGPLRNRRGRHAVPRRDRRHEPADAGEVAARAAGARLRARRQQRVEPAATCASSPPRIATSKNPSCAARSAATCSTASTCSPSRCRRCATRIERPAGADRRFRRASAASRGGRACELLPETLEALGRYPWPGNIRELSNLIERLAILCPERPVGIGDLPARYRPADWTAPEARAHADAARFRSCSASMAGDDGDRGRRPCCRLRCGSASRTRTTRLPEQGVDLRAHLMLIERSLISQALQRSGGTVAHAARLLSLRRTTLVEKLRKLGMAGAKRDVRRSTPELLTSPRLSGLHYCRAGRPVPFPATDLMTLHRRSECPTLM